MATAVKENISKMRADDAALEMVRLLEGYFDELGLSETTEREQRYTSAQRRLEAINAETSTSAA